LILDANTRDHSKSLETLVVRLEDETLDAAA